MPKEEVGKLCTVKEVALGIISVSSHTPQPPEKEAPSSFCSVVESWGNTWMWDNLKITGDIGWIAEAIANNTLSAITDGSYMKDLCPHLNLAAFVLECAKGRGQLMGLFTQHTKDACSYQGELLGLMTIHLIILAADKFTPRIKGLALIYSDCLGALNKVKDLPPYRIPTQCTHSDILKNIMVNCCSISFLLVYSHVRAHQDDRAQYGDLPQPAQLNCQMDYHAKKDIWDTGPACNKTTRRFPLEPVCVSLGKNKLTCDKGEELRFWVHRKLARLVYQDMKILDVIQFDKVDWEMVHMLLWQVPRMLQIWACKQVVNIAPANTNTPWDEGSNPLCPSCAQVPETCSHISYCNHAGRVEALLKSIKLLDTWLGEVDTNCNLRNCIIEYAKGRGGVVISNICRGKAQRYEIMAREQDEIG